MSKINIHTVLTTAENVYEYDVPAIYKEDEKVIIYKEKDEENTTTTYNYGTRELIRENASLIMHYPFNKAKNSRGTIYVKELERTFDLLITTKDILRRDPNVEISFLVEGQEFNYKIEVK